MEQKSFRPTPSQQTLSVLLTGPTGVGKGEVIRSLLQDGRLNLSKVVRHTNRRKRPADIEGKDYYFVSNDVFENRPEETFIEWERHGNRYYGTSRAAYMDALSRSNRVILDVDVFTALRLEPGLSSPASRVLSILLIPVSSEKLQEAGGIDAALEIIHSRILNRGSHEKEHDIAHRLMVARESLKQVHQFQFVIVNAQNQLDQTVNEVKRLIAAF